MSDAELAQKIVKQFLREAGAPGAEHERLKRDLADWATSEGFVSELPELDGGQPDVLRESGRYLFVGDAKDSRHETPENEETVARLLNYFIEFARRVKGDAIDGGYVAIATNDQDAAEVWAALIAAVFSVLGIERRDKRGPGVLYRGENTWIAWW